jgi:hypothetical protein
VRSSMTLFLVTRATAIILKAIQSTNYFPAPRSVEFYRSVPEEQFSNFGARSMFACLYGRPLSSLRTALVTTFHLVETVLDQVLHLSIVLPSGEHASTR